MECYCVARNKPMRSKRTKPQTATVISLWFEGLLAYPELYCDSTFLKNFKCSRFSEFVSNAVHDILIHFIFCRRFVIAIVSFNFISFYLARCLA